jgi:hypothetical protein
MSQTIEGRILEPGAYVLPEQTMRLGEAALLANQQLVDLCGSDGPRGDRLIPVNIATSMNAVSTALDHVRQAVADIDEVHDHAMNGYCCVSAPLELVAAAGGRKEANWRHWLTEGSTDDQLLEFLGWNYEATLAIQNDPQVRMEIARQKASYKIAIERGVHEEWLHPDAVWAIDDMDSAHIYIGDPFDTHFRDMTGYHLRDADDWVVVAGEHFNATWRSGVLANLRRVSKHELNHLSLGELPLFWWLNEAATEHIARSLEEGEPDVLHPQERTRTGTIYDTERMLVNHLLTAGKSKIPVREMTRAYSSSYLDDRWQFIADLNDAWSHVVPDNSAVCRLEDFIGYQEDKLVAGGMRKLVARRQAVKETYDLIRSNPRKVFDRIYSSLILKAVFKDNKENSDRELI